MNWQKGINVRMRAHYYHLMVVEHWVPLRMFPGQWCWRPHETTENRQRTGGIRRRPWRWRFHDFTTNDVAATTANINKISTMARPCGQLSLTSSLRASVPLTMSVGQNSCIYLYGFSLCAPIHFMRHRHRQIDRLWSLDLGFTKSSHWDTHTVMWARLKYH